MQDSAEDGAHIHKSNVWSQETLAPLKSLKKPYNLISHGMIAQNTDWFKAYFFFHHVKSGLNV